MYLRTDGKCDSSWSGPHRVTKIFSDVSVEINGDNVTRHVSHLKRVPQKESRPNGDSESTSDDENLGYGRVEADFPDLEYGGPVPSGNSSDDDDQSFTEQRPQLRRSSRARQRPRYLEDYVF